MPSSSKSNMQQVLLSYMWPTVRNDLWSVNGGCLAVPISSPSNMRQTVLNYMIPVAKNDPCPVNRGCLLVLISLSKMWQVVLVYMGSVDRNYSWLEEGRTHINSVNSWCNEMFNEYAFYLVINSVLKYVNVTLFIYLFYFFSEGVGNDSLFWGCR